MVVFHTSHILWCETESEWKIIWIHSKESKIKPEICPENINHKVQLWSWFEFMNHLDNNLKQDRLGYPMLESMATYENTYIDSKIIIKSKRK